MDIHKDLQAVLDFWFTELQPKDWFAGGETIDQKITARFADVHSHVAAGEYWRERVNPLGSLAEILVLDQFSRNLFRGTSQTFAYDGQALFLAQSVVAKSDYVTLFTKPQCQFLFMPYMHSESRRIHEEALNLFEALGNEEALQYEHIHKDIIDRFGRYPHRNEVLGRASTPEELEYLANTNEDFF